MKISQVITRDPDIVSSETSIRDAARRMRDENVGALPVGENDRLIGMITDRDIATRAVAEDRQPSRTDVREVMSDRILYCFDDGDTRDAAECMSRHQIRRLPVLNRDKRLVGIVSLADIARCGDQDAELIAIEGVSETSDEPRRMVIEIF